MVRADQSRVWGGLEQALGLTGPCSSWPTQHAMLWNSVTSLLHVGSSPPCPKPLSQECGLSITLATITATFVRFMTRAA